MSEKRSIVLVSCTGRSGSNTRKVCENYALLLQSRNIPVKILDLAHLPSNFLEEELHGRRSKKFETYIREYVTDCDRFIFISPEYNGSFPGVLKIFLDSVHPKEWTNKYACLVGVSVGRAGNLRGMEHLTGILNYLKMHVYYNKLPISVVDKVMDETGRFNSEDQIKACVNQVEGFINWTENKGS